MYLLTVVVYPILLALLCLGAGLLVDRLSGSVLPGALIALAGMAALIGLTQLTTWVWWIAPASPAIVAVFALLGLVVGRARLAGLARALQASGAARMQAGATALVYLVAIAPVLVAGRPSFSSYMVLTDSSIHMVGADYLISHGYNFGHLDLSNSYAQLVTSYFNNAYPSGADTLFGASAFLLRLPVIWAFQPFNAFALAMAVGPAWLIVRRIGLDGWWAALAVLTVTVPALVYAYELIASVKEVVALTMLLGIGALVVSHAQWLTGQARRAIPFATLVAAGISAIGMGFGAWVAMAVIVLVVAHRNAISGYAGMAWRAAAPLGAVLCTVAIFALPTWAQASKSLAVTQGIASTTDPGNLQQPLKTVQMIGTWLSSSYLSAPSGVAGTLTQLLMLITVAAGAIGVLHLLRERRWALAAWILGSFAVWLALTAYGTRWVDAKGLVLTSPVLILAAWAGVAALRSQSLAGGGAAVAIGARALAVAVAVLIAGGVLVSDLMQYRASATAPTARYDEMASLNARFAGKGPTLFTDFDEYSLYELRSLDIGGPDFLNPPQSLLDTTRGHGHTVDLERASPAALAHYPLIVTRVDPLAYRPPAAYRMLWQGTYYQVWGRVHGARPAIAAEGLQGGHPASCRLVAHLASVAAHRHAQLVADTYPVVIPIGLAGLHHTSGWYRRRVELVMDTEGRLWGAFKVPRAGTYRLWLQGEAMPTLRVKVDGRFVASVAGQVSGNGDSPDPMVPITMRLSAGRHALSIAREGFSLLPGSTSEAYLEAIYLTPSGQGERQRLRTVAPARWRTLCGAHLDWIEVVPRGVGSGRHGKPLRRQRAGRYLAGLRRAEVPREGADAWTRVDHRPQIGDRLEQADAGADLQVGRVGRIPAKIAAVDPLFDPVEVASKRGEV